MGKNGYRITKGETGWFFELLPSNRNNQPFGISPMYLTKEECITKLEEFIRFLSAKEIKDTSSDYVKIRKTGDLICIFEYARDGKILLYRSLPFNGSSNLSEARDCINRIYKYRNEFLKYRKPEA